MLNISSKHKKQNNYPLTWGREAVKNAMPGAERKEGKVAF